MEVLEASITRGIFADMVRQKKESLFLQHLDDWRTRTKKNEDLIPIDTYRFPLLFMS